LYQETLNDLLILNKILDDNIKSFLYRCTITENGCL
jgi:hypothetical protein